MNGELENRIVESAISTQTEMLNWIDEQPGLAHLSWVQAREQTGGRGRQGKTWVSPRGNLYLSVLYRLDAVDPSVGKHLTWFPLWVGARLREVLAPHVELKWPNDLLYEGRAKVGGILCQKVGTNVVLGIGLNVRSAPEATQVDREVTSLAQADVTPLPSVEALRDSILAAISKPFDLNTLQAELSRHLIPRPGTEIEWVDHSSSALVHRGVVAGLGGFGELHVMSEQGVSHLFSEEVTIRRF